MTIVQCCHCKKQHDVWYECDEVDAMTTPQVHGQPVHYLKCASEFFDPLEEGEKPFEVRLNDRGFRVGDLCVFRRWDGTDYTGKVAIRTVTFVLDDARYCLPGHVVLGLKPCGRNATSAV